MSEPSYSTPANAITKNQVFFPMGKINKYNWNFARPQSINTTVFINFKWTRLPFVSFLRGNRNNYDFTFRWARFSVMTKDNDGLFGRTRLHKITVIFI